MKKIMFAALFATLVLPGCDRDGGGTVPNPDNLSLEFTAAEGIYRGPQNGSGRAAYEVKLTGSAKGDFELRLLCYAAEAADADRAQLSGTFVVGAGAQSGEQVIETGKPTEDGGMAGSYLLELTAEGGDKLSAVDGGSLTFTISEGSVAISGELDLSGYDAEAAVSFTGRLTFTNAVPPDGPGYDAMSADYYGGIYSATADSWDFTLSDGITIDNGEVSGTGTLIFIEAFSTETASAPAIVADTYTMDGGKGPGTFLPGVEDGGEVYSSTASYYEDGTLVKRLPLTGGTFTISVGTRITLTADFTDSEGNVLDVKYSGSPVMNIVPVSEWFTPDASVTGKYLGDLYENGGAAFELIIYDETTSSGLALEGFGSAPEAGQAFDFSGVYEPADDFMPGSLAKGVVDGATNTMTGSYYNIGSPALITGGSLSVRRFGKGYRMEGTLTGIDAATGAEIQTTIALGGDFGFEDLSEIAVYNVEFPLVDCSNYGTWGEYGCSYYSLMFINKPEWSPEPPYAILMVDLFTPGSDPASELTAGTYYRSYEFAPMSFLPGMVVGDSVEPAFLNVVQAPGEVFSIVLTGGTVTVGREGGEYVITTNLTGYHFSDGKPARVKGTYRGEMEISEPL